MEDPSLLLQSTQLDVPDLVAWTNLGPVVDLDLIFQSLDHDVTMPVPVLESDPTSSPASIQASDTQPALLTVPHHGVQYAGTAPVNALADWLLSHSDICLIRLTVE